MLRITIVGRPNVGKSSLFNRLCKRSLAIVNSQQGTTRDRLYGDIPTSGAAIQVIDTGGIDYDSSDHFQKHIYKQALTATQEADLLLLVIDIRCGITEQDAQLAKKLLPLKKPIILVANKADTYREEHRIYELYKLGISSIIATSAAHDKHIDTLLEKIKTLGNLPLEPLTQNTEENLREDIHEDVCTAETPEELFYSNTESNCFIEDVPSFPVVETTNRVLKIALIGRPNVGKSSIINGLLNEERCITDQIPGTTRDNIDILYTHNNTPYLFIDTAGLRKMKSVKNSVEWISSSRTEKAIIRADLCLLVIDATQSLSSYDKRILSLISKQKKPHILLINKWDLMQDIRMEHYCRNLLATDPYLGEARLLCVSAVTKRNLSKIFSAIEDLHSISSRKISTPLVNKTLATALQRHHPQVIHGRRLKIYYGLQKTIAPTQFLLFINSKSLLTKQYEYYLKNTLKSSFNLHGIPFNLEFKEKLKRSN
ncbi:ribosome biogenesis GTPase Der [Candidatus Chlamydia sanziniae]|uniref:GTPase Der n=1 Tax=Candidatus Chlamydia sanziniae TaxID=1806891 RepID=A0A1A9HUG3_9CHLA|nr:ribosome biogenesis GTPase Der [Candidatus Chlamydia sanziniae]ANH78640.1 GTP-binding protein EngA [Candidatus Chlamydia sanziniae]